MTPEPTLQEALDQAVAMTGVERYRDLLNPAHPVYDPRFEPIVRAVASGELPVAPPVPPGEQQARLLALVHACPDRGGVLPHTLQPENCRKCGELSECRRGKGRFPGRVTRADCMACVSETLSRGERWSG